MEQRLLEEERHFQRLFDEVLEETRTKQGLSIEAVDRAIYRINKSFRFDQRRSFASASLSEAGNRCGYLFRHGALGAGLTLVRTLDAAGHCPELRDALADRRQEELRVVSWGMGPGSEALGFCSALRELGFEGRRLSLSVVSGVEEWRECHQRCVSLLREKEFGNASELLRRNEVQTSFVFSNLTELDETLLGTAHVILASELFSHMPLCQVPRWTERLRQTARQDALILLIDSGLELNAEGGLSLRAKRRDDCFEGFELLFWGGPSPYYALSEPPSRKYGHWNNAKSPATIAVLRKK